MAFDFSTAPSPGLDLIDPSNEYASATSYSSPSFTLNSPSSSAGSDVMYASMGLSSIGALITGFTQANAYKAQGQYQSIISGTNAKIAEFQEQQTLEAGDIEASRENLKTQQVVGSERAAQGASGVDVSSGSSVLARESTANIGAQDELTIRNNAQRQAFGYKVQATQDTFAGKFSQMTASNEAEQSILGAGLKAISGPLSIESNYLRWSRGMGGASGAPFPGY